MPNKELEWQNLSEKLSTLEWKAEDVEENIKDKVMDVLNKLFLPILLCLLVASIWLTWFFWVKSYMDTKKLNARYPELYILKNYDTNKLTTNNYTRNEAMDIKQIDDLIDYNIDLQNKANNYIEYLQWIQSPYDNFLKYILLPSLNIWKDPFLWDIRDDYIWLKYLENNPYNDIELIDKWSNFIKDVWSDTEYNNVESIEIWDIVEEWEDFFITIRVKYTANSNRSFLLLVEKLSTTSNQKSISLINELIYYIWELIKDKKWDEVAKIQLANTGFTEDQAIWYNLYQWVKEWKDTNLIDDEIVESAIKKVAQCTTESVEYCYYKFRDKYRNLPSLAYRIWFQSNVEKTESLRLFLADLPQIIKIIDFTYDDSETSLNNLGYSSNQYKWSIEFKIYWDGVSNKEVEEIQELLWNKCLWKALTPSSALTQISDKLVNLWNNANIDSFSAYNLIDIQSLVETISKTFDWLSNYKKVIKTFEMYRMLSEWSVCNL